MAYDWLNVPRSMLAVSLILALTVLVACGTAAPEVVEREVIKEVTVEVPKEVEVVKEIEVPVEVEKEVIREVEVVQEVEVLKEIPKETVVEKTVIATPTPIPVSTGPVETKVDRVIYALGEVQETNRHWTVSRPSYYQFDPYGETLVGLDAHTNERIPRLAESWEWSEDGMQLTMTLMEGVKWSDGAPFTMEDIRFTWEDNILDPNVPSWKTPTSWEIDGTPVTIDFHDDYTFTWNFPVAFPVQKLFDMDFLDFTICPAHVLKPHHPAHGGVDYEAYETSLPPQGLPPVSLGPWVAVEYKTDEFMVMRRNPYYWKVDEAGNQLPYMNEVTFQKGESGIGRTLGTLGGSIDHTNLENPSTYIETTKRQQEEDAHFYVAWGPEALGFPIEFNLSLSHGVENERDQALRELFRDVRFRKAVAYALDRDGIAQSVVRGPFLRGFPGGIVPGAVEFDIESVVNYPYSPESASALLAEIGFEDTNGDGILNWTSGSLEGEELIIGLNTSEDAAATQGVGEAASALLRDVGVEINMRVMQGPALGDANTNGTWEMRVTRTGQHYLTPFTRCTDLGPVTKEYGPHREGAEPRVLLDFEQELIDIINAFCLEPDAATRSELMSRYNRLFTENVYHAGSIIGRYGLAMAKRFKNIPTGAPPFFVHWTWGNVRPEQMWIAEEDQDLVPEIRPGEIPVYN